MHFSSYKYVRRIIILLDTLATTIAFLLALYLRMWIRLVPWQVELYSTIYVLNILIYLFWNTYRRAKHHEYRLTQLDPLENVIRVIRERCFQYVALIVLLSVTHSFERASRLVLLYAGLSDVVFTCLFRLLLRGKLEKEEKRNRRAERFLVVTEEKQKDIAESRLKRGMREQSISVTFFFADAEEKEQEETSLPARLENAVREMEGPFRVYLYLPEADPGLRGEISGFFRERKIPVYVCLFDGGRCLPEKMVHHIGPYAMLEYDSLEKRCDVFGVSFNVSDVESAVFSVLELLNRNSGKEPDLQKEEKQKTQESGDHIQIPGKAGGALAGEYLCFSNVHTTMMAHDDLRYRDILNGAAYTFPDGKPIAEYQKRHGFSKAERIAGPDFMDAMFRATMDGSVTHYFYGSTEETIQKLRENLEKRYPGIRIAGMVSPPFRPETEEEDAETIRRINESGAALIWIGLGAPKQEKWMAAHKGKLNGVMLGVGAGFNFFAGTVKRAPLWVQKVGLEWLYRLFQDPKRLANRYIVTNAKYLWCLFCEDFRRFWHHDS